ncbi:MAG: NAD-dependent DNA ligase LigA [Patescibacteria group bacterium]|nr:NAD-dependent DNA ligase LigA [Patescibacteria group bacterium]
MTKNQIKNRIVKLKDEINFHRYNYHVLDKETISESALDALKYELFKLEQEYPEYITADSPTQRVGSQAVEKFVKSSHFSPMLSLFDAFSEQDMLDWQERIGRFLFPKNANFKIPWNYYTELKLDGLAVNLKYHQGKLVEGASRGDGKIGENISSNIKTIESIPLEFIIPKEVDFKRVGLKGSEIIKIIKSNWIEVRGEAIMTKKTFEKLNLKYQAEGKPLLANTRNGAAGSLRQLNPKLSASRKLQFYAYDIIFYKNNKKINVVLDRERAEKLTKMLGFKIVPHNKVCRTLEEVFAFHRYWEKHKEKLDFNIDGVVVKINELDFWNKLGIIGKAPRYAMAYKFSAEQGTTRIKDVIWQVGRTGILTPTAVLEPVRLGGALISRATLHNMDEIRRLDIMINDTIILERAGDVIPKVVSVLKNLRTGDEQKICTPKKCPMCESKVIKVGEEVAYRCSNTRCFAVNLRQIIHFVSKNAIDIENLGPKVVEQLINAGLISDLADLYNIKKDDLLLLERFAEKSAENLISALNERRKIDLARFVYSLGIRHVGQESAQSLASIIISDSSIDLAKFGDQSLELSVSDFINIASQFDLDKLSQIDDFGPKVSQSIIDYFQDKHNLKILKKLDKAGLKLIIKKTINSQLAQNSKIFGKTFVITGTLNSLTRESAKAKIKELGAKVLSAVSGKLDFLVVGDNPGSKLDKARELRIKILNENDFLKLIEQ